MVEGPAKEEVLVAAKGVEEELVVANLVVEVAAKEEGLVAAKGEEEEQVVVEEEEEVLVVVVAVEEEEMVVGVGRHGLRGRKRCGRGQTMRNGKRGRIANVTNVSLKKTEIKCFPFNYLVL